MIGLIVGLGIAAWLLDTEVSDVSLLDSVGDWFVQLTTTEEARIAQLQPEVQTELRSLLGLLFEAGVPVEVGQTLRTSAQEKALIEAGKTSGSLTVSWHQLGRAVDMYPINPETGVADRNAFRNATEEALRIERFRRMHEIAALRGWRGIAFNADGTRRFISNSKGQKIWDGGHLEWRSPYDTIAQAVQAEGANYGIT